ncbi:MAG: OadG family protein [Porcipelethomonas sp.]
MDLSYLFTMAESVVSEQGYSYVWAVVITGLAVVFLALILLIVFVWLMGKIFTIGKNKKSNSPQQKPAPAAPAKPAAPAAAKTVTAEDDDEIIAVISAAVAAMGQAEGKTYKVKSVRAAKNIPSRSAWAMAGLQSDTMPF